MPISPARTAAFDILLRVETQSAYASELLHSARLDKLSSLDRGLTTEIVMGVLRWRSKLDENIAAASTRRLAKLDLEVLTALRMGAYQLHFLTRIPDSAAIHESVELVKRAKKASAAPFANAVLRKLAKPKPISGAIKQDGSVESIAREYAHPEWLVERWIANLGHENTCAICRQDQFLPNTAVRLEDANVEGELRAEGVELVPGALIRSARIVVAGDVTRTTAFREGRVAIQDEASQLVALLVGTGARLLDCCAAPGGKTAVLASRNPTAEIVAAELHAHRVELLRRRVNAANVKVIQADALNLPVEGQFDCVLADVPCSGTGTLARNPEIKWRLQPEDLADLHAKQVGILQAALQHLAPGGRCVYSTCSLEREEDEAVAEEVLGRERLTGHPGDFRLLDVRDELQLRRDTGELSCEHLGSLVSGKYLRTLPGVHPCDGFFAAVIERNP
jgi:16S rRNA (cytosine967-C5)-methyltransferase